MTGRLELVTEPAHLPVFLIEAKNNLYIRQNDDDALILGYLRSATEAVERYTGRSLIKRGYRLHLDCFADRIDLPRPPLIQVDSVKYDPQAGGEATLDPAIYEVQAVGPGRGSLQLAPGKAWPALTQDKALNRVRIDFQAGYGDLWNDVPGPLKQGILYLTTQYYEAREPVAFSTKPHKVPLTLQFALDPYRVRLL